MQSYNVSFKCKYRDSNHNDAYRDDFLDILGLQKYDDEIVTSRMSMITKEAIKHEALRSIITDSAARVLSEDQEVGVMMLFAYDTLDMFHECLSSLFQDGNIEKSKLDRLREAVVPK